ncbi:MAG TPA: hypothetical protein ENI82_00035 [Bacteroidetes bacterium]|nr:hypothetical protein [Bacteroidota bacterium]
MLLVSCSVFKDGIISLNRKDFNGTNLKIDGYFYRNLKSDIPSINIYFFYRNGVALYGRATPISELTQVEETYISGEFDALSQKSKTGWGVFEIKGTRISFETWEPSSGGPVETVVRSGEILNDTTFVIEKFFNNYDGKTSVGNDTFYFHQFSPKPDSTNTFIN